MSLRKQTPSDFLKQIIGRPVVVKLNSGVDYRGVLACLDGYMNIALEQTEEYVNGQLKNKYGDAFIRGNNGNSSSFGYCSLEGCDLIFTSEFEEWLRYNQAACKNISFRLSWKP
uniref:U6 snRNA-associated Sm-like protein LSm6 n=1 Tax=Falco tinnunculus TaxID=100819 RepID=A0A8C4XKY4_FALTI